MGEGLRTQQIYCTWSQTEETSEGTQSWNICIYINVWNIVFVQECEYIVTSLIIGEFPWLIACWKRKFDTVWLHLKKSAE